MKVIASLLLFISMVAGAQTKFESAIFKGKSLMSEAASAEDFLAAANHFERIAQMETDHWLPVYYQGQSLAFGATRASDPEEKERLLGRSLEVAQSCIQLERNSETLVLEGFIQMLRLSLDPATRGQTLSPGIFSSFSEAMKLEPANPRAYLFMGQMQYGTAQFFGSGYDEACGYIQKANDIFGQMSDDDTIYPDWGTKIARASMERCNEQSKN